MSQNGRRFLFDQLQKMINYAKDEYEITYGEVIQVLEMQKLQLCLDAQEEGEEECENLGI